MTFLVRAYILGTDTSILRLNMELQLRFFKVPSQSFFLFGPRGTGKSTWLRHELRDSLFVDLLQPETFRELSAHPERLKELMLGSPGQKTIVVDEVQRVPELLNVVHDLLTHSHQRRFILTGSSARKLRRGGVDLLAGRAVLRSLHPFMAAEITDFRLASALQQGLLPLVLASDRPEDTLRAYASLYLEQEVKIEGWTRNVGNFARFLEAASFSHGAVLNVSNVARECQIERKTVSAYVEVLEDLLLAFRIPIFTRRARRETVSHPKFYFFDAGVYRSLRPQGPLDRPEEIDGAAFEGLVAQHLRAWIAYSERQVDLFYWRTRSGVEVDFILYGKAGFWAIEVKNTDRVRPQDLKPLQAFLMDYPQCQPIFLYRGKNRLRINDIWCLPAEVFLRELLPSRDIAEAIVTH